MKVTIGGVEYAPLSKMSDGSDETSKAIIRMFTGGYYVSIRCSRSGYETSLDEGCGCSNCQSFRIAVQFLGAEPPCKEEPIIESILEGFK